MRRFLAFALTALLLVIGQQSLAFWQSRDSNYNQNVAAGGGYTGSYTYKADTTGQFAAAPYVSSALNLGSGSTFVIVALGMGGANTITSFTINGSASFTNVTGFSANGRASIWAGTATLTGSDVVTITPSGTSFDDVSIFCYTASNLNSTTKKASAVSASTATLTSAGGTVNVGDFVFAIAAAPGTALDFNSSAQAPASTHTLTGINTTVSTEANWTASSAGISGGNYVATINTSNNDAAIAVWH